MIVTFLTVRPFGTNTRDDGVQYSRNNSMTVLWWYRWASDGWSGLELNLDFCDRTYTMLFKSWIIIRADSPCTRFNRHIFFFIENIHPEVYIGILLFRT